MNIRKILLPCDFADVESKAVGYATAIARDSGAVLLLVHVEMPQMIVDDGGFYGAVTSPFPPKLHEAPWDLVPRDPTIRYECFPLTGKPAEEIVRLAEREEVDMIVMNSHGRKGLDRLWLGSVAEEVMRSAACPVLIVKPNVKAAKNDLAESTA